MKTNVLYLGRNLPMLATTVSSVTALDLHQIKLKLNPVSRYFNDGELDITN